MEPIASAARGHRDPLRRRDLQQNARGSAARRVIGRDAEPAGHQFLDRLLAFSTDRAMTSSMSQTA